MKYRQLTKEQFFELHEEFSKFLATQQIDVKEWKTIKLDRPEVAEEELNIFSDLVWEGVLNKTKFIEHISAQQMHLFQLNESKMHVIAVQIKNAIDITTREGFDWLRNNLMDDDVEFLQAKKDYSEDKNKDKFTLIQQGGLITQGELFQYFDKLIFL